MTSFLAERGPIDYRIELIGYDSDPSGPKIKAAGFYPVAIASDRSVTFAINLDGRDCRIFALHEDTYLYGEEVYGEKSTPYVEFPSYAEMLAEIVSIRREDGTLIERAEMGAAGKSARPRGASRTAKKKRRRKP